MSDINEKVAAAQENAQQTAEKKKKLFEVRSPYDVYADDNDRLTEEMNRMAADRQEKPDTAQLLRTALSAAALVGIFVLIGLAFAAASSCITGQTIL